MQYKKISFIVFKKWCVYQHFYTKDYCNSIKHGGECMAKYCPVWQKLKDAKD